MNEKNYLRIQTLSLVNVALFAWHFRYFLYISKILMSIFAISTFLCTILNFIGIIYLGVIKRKINLVLSSMIFILSIISLRYAIWILETFFHVENVFL